jgi:hypothetical protein
MISASSGAAASHASNDGDSSRVTGWSRTTGPSSG